MSPRGDGGSVSATADTSIFPSAPYFRSPFPESVVKNGAVSGVLPEADFLAVHYPGYPSSTSRAIETLGSLPKISKAWKFAFESLGGTQDSDKDRRSFLELKFRPEDLFCHPAFGEPRPSSSLLLRITRTRNGDATACVGVPSGPTEQISADVVGRISMSYHFEGMADYQHVIAIHAAEARRKKRPWASNDELYLDGNGNVDVDHGDVMMLVPPLFARKDKPEKIVLNPPPNLVSESIQKGAVEYCWEMEIEPCHAIPFSVEKIPEKINWEGKLPKGTSEWKAQMALAKLFEERPIWPRWSLYERLLDDGEEITDYLLRRLLLRTGYYFSRGPYGKFWIQKGYDPRTNSDSRIYQKVDFRVPSNLRKLIDLNENHELKHKWKDICKFLVWPSKACNVFQLFELDDDYIREEIEKPTTMATCSPFTGWFSEALLKALRLRVMIRFLSVAPKGPPEEFWKSKIEDFKRCRKKEALGKFWKPEKELRSCNQDASNPKRPRMKSNNAEKENVENEDIEDEEESDLEEEDIDGYESPPMGDEDDLPPYGATYDMGESIPNEYLQELLSELPWSNKGKAKHSNEEDAHGVGSSDGEYQIYEQESDEEADFL